MPKYIRMATVLVGVNLSAFKVGQMIEIKQCLRIVVLKHMHLQFELDRMEEPSCSCRADWPTDLVNLTTKN